MRVVHLITLGMLATAGGCSGEKSSGGNGAGNVGGAMSNQGGTGNSATPAGASGPSGVEGMRRLAECAETFKALGNLWEAIASQSTGAEKEQEETTALRRRASGGRAGMKAREMAKQLNRPPGEIDRIMEEREALLKRESDRQEFGEFALWLGRESDQCSAFDPSIG